MNRDHRRVLCLWEPQIAHPITAHHNRRWPRACPWQISTITRKPALALWTKMIYWLSLSKSSCSLMACLTSKPSLQISQVRYCKANRVNLASETYVYFKLISQKGSWKICSLKLYRDLFYFYGFMKKNIFLKKFMICFFINQQIQYWFATAIYQFYGSILFERKL